MRVVRPTSGPVEAYEVWHTREFDSTWIFICGLRPPVNLYAPFDGSFYLFWESYAPRLGFAFDERGPGGIWPEVLFWLSSESEPDVDVRCPARREEQRDRHPGGFEHRIVTFLCEVRAGQLVAVLGPGGMQGPFLTTVLTPRSVDDVIRYLQLIFR